MDLILWRHAEAENGFPDMARQLTEKGRIQSSQMAEWLKMQLSEAYRNTSMLVSPATRAQQTAQAFSHDFDITHEIGPGASANQILAAANWPYAKGRIIIVGHQPALGEVARLLLSEIPSGLFLKKGAVWWFQYRKSVENAEIVLHAVKYPDTL